MATIEELFGPAAGEAQPALPMEPGAVTRPADAQVDEDPGLIGFNTAPDEEPPDEAPPAAPTYDPWWDAPFSALLGGAGVGKTFLCKDWAATTPGVVLAATTGIAAINLGGQTINGLLGYYNTDSLRDAYVSGALGARLTKLRKAGLRRIILDEVSMLDGDQLTIFTKVLDELAGVGYGIGIDYSDDEEELPENPEYPVGLTLVGDFAQLPPVKAPFAFESSEWSRYEANTRMLTHIYRQTDRDFIEGLRAARRGDGPAALAYFGPLLQQQTDEQFDGPTLLATNDQVNRYNDLKLTALKTPLLRFPRKQWVGEGRKPPSEWQNIPEVLVLKPGALVMVLANVKAVDDPTQFLYVNGDLGEVLDADEQNGNVTVRLQRTGRDVTVVPVTRTTTIPLEVGRRKELKARGQEHLIDGRREIVAWIDYVPLRLAWATTVHKSQGLSLDRVQVNVNHGFFRTPGMVYVSLSRARTSEGLRLVGSPAAFAARCTVDPKVVPWL